MIVESPAQPIVVDDYDFYFVNGVVMSFEISKDRGDSIDFDNRPLAVQMHFGGKPSPIDPDAKTPPEDVTVLMQHVTMVTHKVRNVIPPTKEQRDLFKQTLIQVSKTVN